MSYTKKGFVINFAAPCRLQVFSAVGDGRAPFSSSTGTRRRRSSARRIRRSRGRTSRQHDDDAIDDDANIDDDAIDGDDADPARGERGATTREWRRADADARASRDGDGVRDHGFWRGGG